jgi:F-type H+-transporting ATPase subunit beta
LKASAARFSSNDSALHGKIHQVIGAVVDGRREFFPTRSSSKNIKAPLEITSQQHYANYYIVKFDTDKLPPILNALETDNGGQRLVLEVAVCIPRKSLQMEQSC